MRRFDLLVERFCEGAVVACGVLLIASALYVSAELLARGFLNISLIGANEISGYLLAIGSAWAFSYTLLKRSHIRIDTFYRLLPERWRATIDLVAVAALAGIGGILAWHGVKSLWFAWSKGVRSITTLAIPLWIPMLAWALGLVLFFLVSLYLTLRSSAALVRGDIAAVQARVGSVSGDEEAVQMVEEELALMHQTTGKAGR